MDNQERLEKEVATLREKLDAHDRQLARIHGIVKKAGGNGSPPWGERIALLEAWQIRQEKILAPLPGQLAAIKLQLEELTWQKHAQYRTRIGVLGNVLAALALAILTALATAALFWWQHGGSF